MKKVELVFIPFPLRGHLVSMVEFAKHLVARDDRLCITVLISKLPFDSKVNAYIDSLTFSSNISERIKCVELPQNEKLSTEPNPVVNSTSFIADQKPHVKSAVAESSKTRDDSPRLAGFVIDMICTSMIDVADEFGVPTYVFFISGAGFLGLMLHFQDLSDHQNIDVTEFANDRDSELVIPSFFNPVPCKVLPILLVDKDAGPVMIHHARKIRETKGILVNTFMELENHAVNSLSGGQFPPVYPVGPVLNMKSDESHGSGVIQKSNIIEWLDDQPPLSVVFLCFGSLGSFSDDQVKEIAYALEHGGHRFLWSLRQTPEKGKMYLPTDFTDFEQVLPKEFLSRTADRGMVIGWAPQVDVLAHPAIGGFVSHCGWNSTLESLWFGVPVATWPITGEQQLNAFKLVKEFGCAAEIKLDYRREFNDIEGRDVAVVSAQEIERGIKKVMEHDSEIRKRAKEISEKSKKSLMVGGSFYSSLDRFINDVLDNLP